MRLALVHDWVTGLRGGERVLDVLARAHPDASLHTLIHRPGTTTPAIDALRRHTSPIDRWPGIARHYRKALPLLPWAAGRLAPRDCDLVLSIHHAVAKSVRVPEGVPHLCYCLTPMRYVWDQADAYLGRGARRALAAPLVAALRRHDRAHASAARVTRFVAISSAVADRIDRHYGRGARVVPPPVEVDRFAPSAEAPGDAYLLVGAFVPYKREAVAIEAFRRSGRPLVIVGDGPGRARLERTAPPNVTFTGRIPDAELADRMARCRALIHPQDEDFGIAAVEVQAAGRPVIAWARGGALDTVRPLDPDPVDPSATSSDAAPTGILYRGAGPDALAEAVETFERNAGAFEPAALRRHAERYAPARFLEALAREIDAALAGDPDPPRPGAVG